jgi:hypothetical protein
VIADLRHRRYFVAALAGTISVALIVLVAASPLALRELASSFDLNWSSLSNIGQTYGAVSALITGLALGGVAISLFYQAKDVSTTRSQAVRTFHHELLRMELDDEDCMWASGAPWGTAVPANYRDLRLHVYVHMWVSFWESQFIIGEMPEEAVRSSATELFSGISGRDYWRRAGQQRLSLYKGRRLAFVRIMDEEYREAIKTSVVTPQKTASQHEAVEAVKPKNSKSAMPFVMSAAAGLITGWLARNQAVRVASAAKAQLPQGYGPRP